MKFVDAYKKKYGLEPEGYGTSSSYMAVYTLKDAIERAGTLDSDKVAEALRKTDLWSGGESASISKTTRSSQPRSAKPRGTIFQWQDGKRVVVFPESIAKGKVLLPPWMKK
jgi:branched-chain amino acid transport system substrate-binding protein